MENTIEIYAELSKKQYQLIQSGNATIQIPYGTKMINKKGSRGLYFYCEDDKVAQELVEGLNNSNINWQ